MQQEAVEAVAAVGSKMTYGGAGTAVFFGLTAEFWGVICGLIVGIAGLLINQYYKRKADRYREIEHKLRVKWFEQNGVLGDEGEE